MEDSNTLKPFSINTNGVDYTLEILASKIESGDIEVPEFQRSHVWQIGKASKLIESFLLGLPVPQVFLYQDPNTQKLLVVDGQQRLMSIRYFLKGVYKGKEFRLTGINDAWNGKTFDELSESDQRRFKNITLRATVFQQVDPSDNQSIFEVFERLNTGGMSLSPQEVRNAVIGGDLNKLSKKLNSNPTWKRLINKKTDDDRQRDIELIVRILSLLENYTTYKKPMNIFLNDMLKKYELLNTAKQGELEDLFERVISIISTSIGDGAFKLKQSVSPSIAESIFIGIAKNLADNTLTQDLRGAYKLLVTDSQFINFSQQHTTDVENVKYRIESAIKKFKA